MLRHVARKEFVDMLRDGRFRMSAGIVGGLLGVALVAGALTARERRAERNAAQSTMQEMWVGQPAKNPHSAAHYGLWAFKPTMPLSYVDPGVDPFVGSAAWLEAHRQNEFRFRPAMDATAVQRFGSWTTAAVLQLLIPLLIVVLAAPAFAGEREAGTLRQLASLGLPARELAMGKSLGVAGALACLLVPAAIAGVVVLAVSAGGGAMLSDIDRLALLALAYLAYFAVFIGVSLAVSARATSTRTALLALLGFWAMNGLVAPRAMADVSRMVFPTPSAYQFANDVARDIANGIDGHATAGERAAAFRDSLLRAHNVTRVEDLPTNLEATAMQASEEYGNRVFDRHFGSLYDTYERQSLLQQAGAFVSPLMAVRTISMALAGTDVRQHRDFATAAEEYRRYLMKEMNDHLATETKAGQTFSYRATPELWSKTRPFTYTAPSTASVVASNGLSALLLAGWALAAIAGVMRMRRLRIM